MKCSLCEQEFSDSRGFRIHMAKIHQSKGKRFTIWFDYEKWEKVRDVAKREKKTIPSLIGEILEKNVEQMNEVKIQQIKREYEGEIEERDKRITKLERKVNELSELILKRLSAISIQKEIEDAHKMDYTQFMLENVEGFEKTMEAMELESIENDLIRKEWEMLDTEQIDKVRGLVDRKGMSLPQAIKKVKQNCCSDFEKFFREELTVMEK
jgi:vacuolar-type H+-ATPase subunit I/STV1